MPSDVISDQPTLRDGLDRLGMVKGIAQQISGCAPPQTFGVHGDWGAGKTSLLRQLRYHLTGEAEGATDDPLPGLLKAHYKQQVVTVWFEAWRFQNEPVPVVALLKLPESSAAVTYTDPTLFVYGRLTGSVQWNNVVGSPGRGEFGRVESLNIQELTWDAD